MTPAVPLGTGYVGENEKMRIVLRTYGTPFPAIRQFSTHMVSLKGQSFNEASKNRFQC
jgi:hypothetical protein